MLTREDWNDISKLRLRDYDANILEVKVFDSNIANVRYPVRVLMKRKWGYGGYEFHSYTVEGFADDSGCLDVMDIIKIDAEIEAEQSPVEWLVNELLKFEKGESKYLSKVAIQNHAIRMEKQNGNV